MTVWELGWDLWDLLHDAEKSLGGIESTSELYNSLKVLIHASENAGLVFNKTRLLCTWILNLIFPSVRAQLFTRKLACGTWCTIRSYSYLR